MNSTEVVALIQRGKRRNTCCQELVDEVTVEFDSGLIDGIVFAAFRDQSRPRDGEAVGVDAERFHHCKICLAIGMCLGVSLADTPRPSSYARNDRMC